MSRSGLEPHMRNDTDRPRLHCAPPDKAQNNRIEIADVLQEIGTTHRAYGYAAK